MGSIIEITNRNYRTMGLQEFFANLNNRAKLDLRGIKILLVFDRFEKLTSEYSLKRFFKLVSQLTVKCGIIVRTDERQLDRIKARYPDIYAHMIQFDRKTTRKLTPDDIVAFCWILSSSRCFKQQYANG